MGRLFGLVEPGLATTKGTARDKHAAREPASRHIISCKEE